MKTTLLRHLAPCSLALVGLAACEPGPAALPASSSVASVGAGGDQASPAPSETASGTAGTGVSTSSGSSSTAGGGGGSVAPTKTVLLIPGTMITGSYFDTMAARLTTDGYEPIVYESADLMTGSLVDEAGLIGQEVQKVLAKTGESRLHIVAQCDGGVATRYWLERLGGDAYVDQVVTFVSAHHGTWLSPIGQWVSGYQALADIKPDSPFMSDLNGAKFPAGLKLTSIYSCNDELMVPFDTSVVDGATNVLFCNQVITHFDPFWDPIVYGRIQATLAGQGDQAPTSY